MSVEDISNIAGKFKKVSELKAYSDDLFKKLKAAVEKLQEQEKEIAHLKELLTYNAKSNLIASPHSIPPELLLCEMEILRLQKTAEERSLSLEETKRFDMLVGNMHDIKKEMRESAKDSDSDHLVEFDESKLISIIKS